MSKIVALLFCFYSFSSWAKVNSAGARVLTARLGTTNTALNYNLENQDSELTGPTLTLKPNAPSKTFISVSYDWFGLSVGAVNPVSSEVEKLRGQTSASDYQFRFYFPQVSIEAIYQKYTGYYIENTQDVVAGWGDNQPSRLLPQLETQNIELIATYVFNPDKYSIAAAHDQSVRQTESGGSWISTASISQQSFSNPTTLIPIELTGKYGEFEKVTDGRFLTAAIGFGGAYTLVFNESFYLSAHFIVNLAANSSSYIKSGADKSETSVSSLSHTKIGFGYNGDKFICGLSVNIDSTNRRVEQVNNIFSATEAKLFVGTRFDM